MSRGQGVTFFVNNSRKAPRPNPNCQIQPNVKNIHHRNLLYINPDAFTATQQKLLNYTFCHIWMPQEFRQLRKNFFLRLERQKRYHNPYVHRHPDPLKLETLKLETLKPYEKDDSFDPGHWYTIVRCPGSGCAHCQIYPDRQQQAERDDRSYALWSAV